LIKKKNLNLKKKILERKRPKIPLRDVEIA